MTFTDQGDNYTLLDKEFMKSSNLQVPTTEEDVLLFYSSLQKNALVYNIFITPIANITKWNQLPGSVPTTCALQVTNKTPTSRLINVWQQQSSTKSVK